MREPRKGRSAVRAPQCLPAAQNATDAPIVARGLSPREHTDVPQLRLVNSQEAARLLAISERSLWTLANMRAIATVRIGRCLRFDLCDLEDYIAQNKQLPRVRR